MGKIKDSLSNIGRTGIYVTETNLITSIILGGAERMITRITDFVDYVDSYTSDDEDYDEEDEYYEDDDEYYYDDYDYEDDDLTYY